MNSLDKMEDYDRLLKENTQLKSELTELKLDLEVSNTDWEILAADFRAMKERAESAEKNLAAANKRIEEAEKQEPDCQITGEPKSRFPDVRYLAYDEGRTLPLGTKLYAKPIPPADVAELQRELLSERLASDTNAYIAQERIAELERSVTIKQNEVDALCDHAEQHAKAIRELERKLAEQQALVKKLHGYSPASWLDDCSGPGFEELNKLLSQEREKAVPEGWQVVPKELTNAMCDAAYDCDISSHLPSTYREVYRAMLAAAQSPASLNEKEGGE